MKRVVAPLSIKDLKISSPTGTVKDPLKSGHSSHEGKGKFKWTIWHNGGGKKKRLREQYVSKCQGLFGTWRCTSLSLTFLPLCEVQFMIIIYSVITEPTAEAFRVRWSTDMPHHLWPTVVCNITGIFHIFLISVEVVQVTFLCDNQMWQRQILVNCSPLGDIWRFWVKWEANSCVMIDVCSYHLHFTSWLVWGCDIAQS